MQVQVGPSAVTIHSSDHIVVCEPDSKMSSPKEQGYFSRDTRFISGYRLKLGRTTPILLNSSEVEHFSSRFEFTNPEIHAPDGMIPASSIHLRLDRTVGQGVHEDYDVVNHSGMPVEVEVEVSFESDFADLFDVKHGRLTRRGSIQTAWDEECASLTTRYRNGEFHRSIEIRAEKSGSPTEFANGAFTWRLRLAPGATWHSCLLWTVRLGEELEDEVPDLACHSLFGKGSDHDASLSEWKQSTTRIVTSDPVVNTIIDQASDDLLSLRMTVRNLDTFETTEDPNGNPQFPWVPAAGVPWFVSLFGRDSLITGIQTLSLTPKFTNGTLKALSKLQADTYEDERDMQPGKIEHEIRHGELARLKLIPHTPYYGTHDATTLFVLAAARTWDWCADRKTIDILRPHVERALSWIDNDGDSDGDGLQEYKTRAGKAGYYNQGWKDAGDAIVGDDGADSELPIALCELQAYVIEAKRSWARVLRQAYGDDDAARRLESEAGKLAEMVESLFWWEEEGTYFLGLDGRKEPIRTVASNAAHMLWCNVPEPTRAKRVVNRLIQEDMHSGWGIRTLSSRHRRYNPFSYQLGSVWPHDNIIAAAGFRNYGLNQEAQFVIKGILDAASMFRSSRLPELFSGLHRDRGSFPVQYLGANVPQAWAAGSIIHAVATLVGIEARAKDGRLIFRPALPEWLDSVEMHRIHVGSSEISVRIERDVHGTHSLRELGSSGDLEAVIES